MILCTDGKANIGLGKMEDTPSVTSGTPYFYKRVAQQAVDSGWARSGEFKSCNEIPKLVIEDTMAFDAFKTFNCKFNYYVSIIINWCIFYLSVIISVMTFEGTDCCLADIGRLADSTGGRVRQSHKAFSLRMLMMQPLEGTT